MKKFGRFFASMLALTSLAPNVVLGASGDIYDMSMKMKYDINSSTDRDTFKQNLKSGFANPTTLYIENSNGVLLNYDDETLARRRAIIDVMVLHGIDIGDSEAFKNGVITYATEIQAKQDELIQKLPTLERPRESVSASTTVPMFASAETKIKKTDTSTHVTVNSVTKTDSTNYTDQVYIKVKTLDNKTTLVETKEVTLGEELIIDSVGGLTIMLSDNKDMRGALLIDTDVIFESDWKIDTTESTIGVGLTGNPTDKYTVAWDLQLREVNSNGDTRPYTNPLTLSLVDKTTLSEITNFDVTSQTGSQKFDEFSSLDFLVYVHDTATGKLLAKVDPIVINYEVPNKLSISIDDSQQKDRKRIVVTPTTTDYTGTYYVVVSQDNSEVYTNTRESTETSEFDLTEGQYTITAYTDSRKNVKLSSEDIDFKWVIPDGIELNPGDVHIPGKAWDETMTLTHAVSITHARTIQTGETFKIEIIDLKDDSSVFKGEITNNTNIVLPVRVGTEFRINLLDHSDTVLNSYNRVLPAFTQVTLAQATRIYASSNRIEIDLLENTNYPVSDFNKVFNGPLLTFKKGSEILFTLDVPPLSSGVNTIDVPEEFSTQLAKVDRVSYTFTDKYGIESSIGTDIQQRTRSTMVDPPVLEIPTFPELPELPELPDDDLEFEETTAVDFTSNSEFLDDYTLELLSEANLITIELDTPNSDSEPFKVEQTELPNIHSGRDEDDELLEDIQLDDDI